MGRGMYRFADMPSLGNPDLATVALKVPKGVICLISALSYHELTTEFPAKFILALPRGSEPPKARLSRRSVFSGSVALLLRRIEQHDVDGIPVKVYNPAKTWLTVLNTAIRSASTLSWRL